MSEDIINIEVAPPPDRYDRLRLSGWDAETLRGARILVAGAGALGNEVVKNLALLGVGSVLIVDFDTVEVTNFSRSAFFRPGDEGQRKAELVARRATELNPDMRVSWLHGDLMWQLGSGVFRRVDLVLGCLDNRAARMTINRFCWLMGKPWVDGSLNGTDGRIRLYGPSASPCYECSLSDSDYAVLYERFSCLGGLRDTAQGIIPTTPTAAAIIAAMQVQEAVRWLHGRPLAFGTETVYTSEPMTLFTLTLRSKEECLSHEVAQPLIELAQATAGQTTVGELVAAAQQELGEGVALDLDREVVMFLYCQQCQQLEEWVGPVFAKEATCRRCGAERVVVSTHRIDATSPLLNRTLAAIGIPPGHIVRARRGAEYRYFELSGDFPAALEPNRVAGDDDGGIHT